MDDIIAMKQDLQQAIAKNIREFDSHYNLLVFEDDTKEFLQCFFAYKNVKISIDNNKLLYHIVLDDEVINSFNKEDIDKLKKIDWIITVENILNNEIERAKTIEQKEIEENCLIKLINSRIKNIKVKYRLPTSNELIDIKFIQKIFKDIYNLDFKYNISNDFISLYLEEKEINLNFEQLNAIKVATENFFDVFCIVPKYKTDNEDDDEIDKVRLFLGIQLSEVNK